MNQACGTDIQYASDLLKSGKLVAIPTETVYGLAANGLNEEAVLSIFKAKNRPDFDPLILHVANMEAAFALASEVPEMAKKLAEAFWPGPLTLVLPKKNTVPYVVSSGLETVGLRVPNHPLSLALLNALPFPLAAPSANPFGYISPTTAEHVMENLGNRVDYTLDGGPCAMGLESTIIGFENGEPQILRRGSLAKSAIEKVTGPISERINVSGNPKAPGQLSVHYAPRKKLVLINSEEDISEEILNTPFTLLRFGTNLSYLKGKEALELNFSADANYSEAARKFYAMLREADAGNPELLVSAYITGHEMADAINDRLKRAATFNITTHE